METKYNLIDHILYLCGKCGAMRIANRIDFDLKDSVFVIIDCPECAKLELTNDPMYYFGKNGFLGDGENNNGQN